jgi:hypothetical protein
MQTLKQWKDWVAKFLKNSRCAIENHVACKVAHLRGAHMQIESMVKLSGAWSCARNITIKSFRNKMKTKPNLTQRKKTKWKIKTVTIDLIKDAEGSH